MNIFFTVIIVLSAIITLLMCIMLSNKYAPRSDHPGLLCLCYALWLVAVVVFGPHFFKYPFALNLGIPLSFDISIERGLFICIVTAMIFGLYSGRIDMGKNFTVELLMLVFCIICFVSMIQHGFTRSSEFYPAPRNCFINGYFFPFLCFVFAKYYLSTEKGVSVVLHTLFFLGVYLAVISFFEFFDLDRFVFPRYITDEDFLIHLGRARGPLLNSAFNGLALAIGFICGIQLLPQKKGIPRTFYTACLLIFFPAAFFTQTRSVYLSFLMMLVFLFSFYRTTFSKMKAFSLPICLVLVFLLFNSPKFFSQDRRIGGLFQSDEIAQRLGLIKRSIHMIYDNPFFGVGFSQFVPTEVQEYSGRINLYAGQDTIAQHNHLLGLWAELGFLGFFIYISIITVIFRHIFLLFSTIPERGCLGRNFLIAVTAIWIVYINNNMFVEPSFSLFVNAAPFTFAGITDGLYGKSASAEFSMQPLTLRTVS